MSDQNVTVPKDPVTLSQLRKAIAEYQKAKAAFARNCSMGWDIDACRSDAWRAAFEWHVGLIKRHEDRSEELAHLADFIALDCEEEDGMVLIREKLQS